MSAQAVLSVTAPTVSSRSRGGPEAADSGFDSMLAEVVDSDSGPDEVDASAAPSGDKAAADATQADLDATIVPETPVPATPLPVMLAAALPIPERVGETANPATPTAPDAGEPVNIGSEAPVDGLDATAAPAAGTTPANARDAVPAATSTPVTTTSPAPPPPPALRPLAERTSKPVEVADKYAETAADPRSAGSSPAPTPAGLQADGGARPAELTIKAGVETPLTPLNDDAFEPEGQAPGDAAASQTQAPAATRDVALSGLSRATIDATAQIAAQILRKLEGRSTRFEMALHPEDLGRVDVKLDIDAGGRLSARLAFDNPAAATDLRGRADELRRQLEDAGFHLAEDAFEFAERDSGSSAFDRGRDARHGQNRAFAAAARLNDEVDVAQPPRWLALKLSPSGVDMKV